MFADIASGYGGTADVLFLIAAILFALEAVIVFASSPGSWPPVLRPAGLCLVAVALLLL